MVANLMFDLPAVTLSTHTRSTSGLWLGEVVAAFGLLLVILGVVRAGRASVAAFAVGGYIAAAYWFTSSTSFANPAVTIGRTLTNTFAGIAPSSVPIFIVMQVLGALLAVAFGPLPVPRHPGHRSRRSPRIPGGTMTDARPSVLFLCVHNAGRSQMALGWFNHLAGDRAVAWSGGSEPGDEVNPAAHRGDGRARHRHQQRIPETVDRRDRRAADVVVTMGCGDACPLVPGKRYEDWVLDDPAGMDVEAVRPIRDEIGERVRELLASLDVPTG